MFKKSHFIFLILLLSGFAFYISAKEDSNVPKSNNHIDAQISILDKIVELRKTQLKQIETRRREGVSDIKSYYIKREFYEAQLKRALIINDASNISAFREKLVTFMKELEKVKDIETDLGWDSQLYEDTQFWFLDLKLDLIQNYGYQL